MLFINFVCFSYCSRIIIQIPRPVNTELWRRKHVRLCDLQIGRPSRVFDPEYVPVIRWMIIPRTLTVIGQIDFDSFQNTHLVFHDGGNVVEDSVRTVEAVTGPISFDTMSGSV